MKKYIILVGLFMLFLTNTALADFPESVCDSANEATLGISSAECDILRDFYNRTNGDSWTDHTNWGTVSSVNTWYGVTTSGGHVYTISLNSNNLSGDIGSWDISGLSNLFSFYIQNNQLTGDITSWDISSLSNLGGFAIFNNQFTGNITSWDISGLTGLYYFYINNNQLTGNITSWDISGLPHITHFVLRSNQLTGDITSWDISSRTSLVYFYLNDNQLTGDITSWDISNLTNLMVFNISQNQLTGDITSWNISGLTNLAYFLINNNQFTGDIPDFDQVGMSYFELNDNKFTFSNIEPRITKINAVQNHTYSPQANVDTTRTINVNSGETLTITPELPINPSNNDSYEWFKDGVSLGASSTNGRIFTKSNVDSGDAGVYTYKVTNANVSELTLTSNDITVTVTDSSDTTPPTLNETVAVINPTNDSTPTFVFNSNEVGNITYQGSCSSNTSVAAIGDNIIVLTGTDGNALADGTYSDCGIVVTDASGNASNVLNISEFTVDTSISFPASVCDQSNEMILGIPATECLILKSLYDSTNGNNWVNDDDWGTVSSANTWYGVTVNGGHVSEIRLDNNNLSGGISSVDLTNLTELTHLVLNSNQLTGNISAWDISNLTHLVVFNINSNQLTGDISAWDISNLTSLSGFDIGSNQFTGNISAWDISNLVNATNISIRNNQFTGDVGSWDISGLTNLIYFHIDNNQLTGDITSWDISNITTLAHFYINNNQLTGDITSWNMSGLTNLIEFIIYNNQLTGIIPDFDQVGMNYFELNDNKFTFSNIEPRITKINAVQDHTYSPQANVDTTRTINVNSGETLTITPELPINPSNNDSYEWFKDGVSLGASSTNGRIFTKSNVDSGDAGVYTYKVTNANVSELTLTSNDITVVVDSNNTATIRADVDQNSVINSTDAMLTLRDSVGLDMSGTNWQTSATTGDADCDGDTDSTDAMLILRDSLGLDMSTTGWCVN